MGSFQSPFLCAVGMKYTVIFSNDQFLVNRRYRHSLSYVLGLKVIVPYFTDLENEQGSERFPHKSALDYRMAILDCCQLVQAAPSRQGLEK